MAMIKNVCGLRLWGCGVVVPFGVETTSIQGESVGEARLGEVVGCSALLRRVLGVFLGL